MKKLPKNEFTLANISRLVVLCLCFYLHVGLGIIVLLWMVYKAKKRKEPKQPLITVTKNPNKK